MKTYKIKIGSYHLGPDVRKEQIVELKDGELPTAQNLISQHLINYFSNHIEELNLPDDKHINITIARIAFHETNDIIDKLFYFTAEEVTTY